MRAVPAASSSPVIQQEKPYEPLLSDRSSEFARLRKAGTLDRITNRKANESAELPVAADLIGTSIIATG
jgi:hypothetical protein